MRMIYLCMYDTFNYLSGKHAYPNPAYGDIAGSECN